MIVYQGTENSVLCLRVGVVMCSARLSAIISIRMGPNLDTTCIAELSRGSFFEFSKFCIFTPSLACRKAF